MNRQAVNPYLPSWEYIPDGEPHVFNGRVYVYGSHDRFNAPIFCVNDYVCWSAPVEDLSEWRYEGVIYRKKQDPKNPLGYHLLFAPDVCQGPDGRYYLYYAFDFLGIMSVAVCDTPAGEYKFLGHIHYADGTLWGRRRGDQLPFDPGVLADDDGRVWLYSGFYNAVPAILTGGHKLRCDGGTVLELEKDMVTIKTEPRVIFPKKGPGAFQGHEFFEASSIRKEGKTYIFVYSSRHNHELCYATSQSPDRDFSYGGTLVSQGDIFLDSNLSEKHAANYLGNTHGGLLKLEDKWYVFYHRQTNRHSYDGEKITLDVAVKNTGDTAGKYVAEIFYEPPYYNGGIEKAAANLVQYAKTEILQPGEAQTLKITFRYEDMASYDSNGIKSANGAYVLEAGDYKINLCSDSHTILDTYVAKVDKDVIYDDAHDGARSTDQVAATNQLTFAQGDVTYLSRADGFANYAEATAAPANHSLSAQALADYASAATFDAAKYDDPNAVMPTTGANNGLKLADLTGVAYDDPKWEQLLDELTVNDLFSLTADGGYHTVGVESIGLSATEDCDGPTGVHSNYNPAAGPSYPGTVMLACTWNQPLAKARGEQIAKECAEINCTGWYAPAMNIHRSAFGGRNFEYYSECGVLSGLTAAAEVSGATENGLICYVKHFAFNDQDNYRQNNICTWLNEQSAREIYLKAFEQPIKAGGMGVMTSMNAVGPVWAGGCKALLTNILRDEWGFHGAVITDAVVSAWYMDGNLAIRTGGTKMLAFNITNEFYRDLNSVGTVTAMRNAAHGTLYALANSFAVTRAVSVPKWVKTTYAVDAVVAIILVAWEICAIRKYRKAKKEDEDTEQ